MIMFLLILDSLGTSELLVILVFALIFFGPRKLPEISRQIGKSLAEFRRASEDFKRTWEREVALETAKPEPETERTILPRDDSITETTVEHGQAIHDAATVPESTSAPEDAPVSAPITGEPASVTANERPQFEPTRKRDWL